MFAASPGGKEVFMKKTFLKAVVLASILFLPCEALAAVRVEGRYWFSEIDPEINITEGGLAGTDIDLVDDLGFDDSENFWEGRISLGLGKHKIRYGFIPMEWDGEKTLAADINFAGTTYAATTFVTSVLAIDYHRLGYEYDFFKVLGNYAGVIVEAKYFDMEAELRSSSTRERESVKVALPAIGVGFGLKLPLAGLKGEVTGVGAGTIGRLVDAEAALTVIPAPFVTLSGGYRFLELKADKDDTEVDFTLDGPFATLSIGF
jgi:hypothetical protein